MVLVNIEMRSVMPRFNLIARYELCQTLKRGKKDTLTTAQQFLYASQLLSVIVIACSKAAVVLLVVSLKPFKAMLVACKVAMGFIGLWGVIAIITLAVQCDLRTDSGPWDFSPGRKCLNREALYIGLAACSIVLDVVVIVLPIVLLWNVQMTTAKRRQVSALFALRIM